MGLWLSLPGVPTRRITQRYQRWSTFPLQSYPGWYRGETITLWTTSTAKTDCEPFLGRPGFEPSEGDVCLYTFGFSVALWHESIYVLGRILG